MTVREVIHVLEELAPGSLQESYDNTGLNVGDENAEVTGILCTLDVTQEVLEEAIALKANLILAHHPLIFQGLKSISGKNMVEKLVINAIRNGINIYAGHTNFDNVPGGVNTMICQKLALKNCRILAPMKDDLYKLVTFVPDDHANAVREALFSAGAGHIGDYDSCSFNTKGEGTFRGLEGSDQFVGEKGHVHYENEVKVEVILPRFQKGKIIKALLAGHPYEEVAYDLYPLANDNPYAGAGMVGDFENPIKLQDLLIRLKKIFFAEGIRYTGNEDKTISKVAVCGGSGAFLIHQAKRSDAEVFITGDIKYHQFFDGDDQLSLIDIGHYESEQFTKDIFYESVMKKIPKFAVHLSKVKTNPIKYYK